MHFLQLGSQHQQVAHEPPASNQRGISCPQTSVPSSDWYYRRGSATADRKIMDGSRIHRGPDFLCPPLPRWSTMKLVWRPPHLRTVHATAIRQRPSYWQSAAGSAARSFFDAIYSRRCSLFRSSYSMADNAGQSRELIYIPEVDLEAFEGYTIGGFHPIAIRDTLRLLHDIDSMHPGQQFIPCLLAQTDVTCAL